MFRRILAVVAALLSGQLVNGQTLPSPVTTITSFPPVATTPSGNPYGFSTAMRFSPAGLLYAWDCQNVWRQSGVNVDSFGAAPIGTVPSNGADAGPINFSQDGKTLLIGNGSGGYDFSGSSSGLLFTMPVTGGPATPAGTLLYHFDFVPSPVASTIPNSATKFVVDRGSADFSTSEVDVFNDATGASAPLIRNIPGASSSIAFDSANRLYVSIGFGPSRGQIRRFTLPQLDLAAGGAPLDWTSGQLFNSADNNSGSGMFFDGRGDLFVGGPNGIAVFDHSGASQSYSTGTNSFPSITRNAVNDQFALLLGGTNDPLHLGYSPLIYRAADFSVPSPAPVTWIADSGGNWSDVTKWDPQAAPNGMNQKAVLDGAITAPRTIVLDAPVTLGSLTMSSSQKYTISGPNALILQVSTTIASINVAAGSHEIAAPLILARDTDITVANATDTLTLSGGIFGSGMLSKEGGGTLVISAANSYAGNTAVDGGRLRFQVSSGSPAVASGSVASIAPGTTLELAGVISALGASGGNRATIINDSATGLLIAGKNQIVGGIDGAGATVIDAGSDLTADHIIQSALMIGGTTTAHGRLTIAPSDAAGDPLLQADSVAVGAPFDAAGETTSAPEPTSLLLALVAAVTIVFLQFRRRGRNL